MQHKINTSTGKFEFCLNLSLQEVSAIHYWAKKVFQQVKAADSHFVVIEKPIISMNELELLVDKLNPDFSDSMS